ncbi:hypothetical protein Tco_1114514 [Tanacetum coccineum]|uniref:Uncharacterized protein n=1 Tax=Tanacetum coccineum TaxID=301880 RepID=A0ABQ5IWC4_9ASTR
MPKTVSPKKYTVIGHWYDLILDVVAIAVAVVKVEGVEEKVLSDSNSVLSDSNLVLGFEFNVLGANNRGCKRANDETARVKPSPLRLQVFHSLGGEELPKVAEPVFLLLITSMERIDPVFKRTPMFVNSVAGNLGSCIEHQLLDSRKFSRGANRGGASRGTEGRRVVEESGKEANSDLLSDARSRPGLAESVIMEYICVKHGKRRAFLELKLKIFEDLLFEGPNTLYPSRRYGVSVPALTKDHRRLKINTPYPEDSIRRIQDMESI